MAMAEFVVAMCCLKVREGQVVAVIPSWKMKECLGVVTENC